MIVAPKGNGNSLFLSRIHLVGQIQTWRIGGILKLDCKLLKK